MKQSEIRKELDDLSENIELLRSEVKALVLEVHILCENIKDSVSDKKPHLLNVEKR